MEVGASTPFGKAKNKPACAVDDVKHEDVIARPNYESLVVATPKTDLKPSKLLPCDVQVLKSTDRPTSSCSSADSFNGHQVLLVERSNNRKDTMMSRSKHGLLRGVADRSGVDDKRLRSNYARSATQPVQKNSPADFFPAREKSSIERRGHKVIQCTRQMHRI